MSRGTGQPLRELQWELPLSKLFALLHAAAVYNGTPTRWLTSDPAARAALRTALHTAAVAAQQPPPSADPYAAAADWD